MYFLESLSHSCPTEDWQWLLFVFAATDGRHEFADWVTGLPTLVRSFDSRKSAQVWANEKDNEQLRGAYRDESDVQKTTLSQLIDRYLVDVTPCWRC